MGSNDNKRYYWLKLKKDFFQQHQIKVLKALPNGRLYALIYLELLAESCSHDGELRFSKMMPYDTVTLAAVIDEDKDNLEKAIETLERLELVEIIDDGTIYMSEIERLLGSETGQTIRKRESKIAQGKFGVKNTLEYRDKSKEKRDKNIMPPTIEEVAAYCKERQNDVDPKRFFDYYSAGNWKDAKGQPVKNWKQKMIANWEKKEAKKTDEPLPVYDTKSNREMTKDEEKELMRLMGK